MDRFTKILAGSAIAISACACQGLFSKADGFLSVSFQKEAFPYSKSSGDMPDTDDFILTITDSKSNIIYHGSFGDSPEDITVPPGSYTVSAVSSEFSTPSFEKPVFGDTQVVVVSSGCNTAVTLNCQQLNSGIRLSADNQFKKLFPEARFAIKGLDGSLYYRYDETRTAFFNPGNVSVSLNDAGKEQTLFSRTLEAQQILTINISTSLSGASGGISIQVDTTRERVSSGYVYGDDGGNSIEDAYTVTEARSHIGETGVWVTGYIVGIAKGTGSFSFEKPFDKNTNLILGLRSSTINKEYCLSVELKSGSIRDDLNLIDNPGCKGKAIYMKGDLVSSYYGIPGLKNIAEYLFR